MGTRQSTPTPTKPIKPVTLDDNELQKVNKAMTKFFNQFQSGRFVTYAEKLPESVQILLNKQCERAIKHQNVFPCLLKQLESYRSDSQKNRRIISESSLAKYQSRLASFEMIQYMYVTIYSYISHLSVKEFVLRPCNMEFLKYIQNQDNSLDLLFQTTNELAALINEFEEEQTKTTLEKKQIRGQIVNKLVFLNENIETSLPLVQTIQSVLDEFDSELPSPRKQSYQLTILSRLRTFFTNGTLLRLLFTLVVCTTVTLPIVGDVTSEFSSANTGTFISSVKDLTSYAVTTLRGMSSSFMPAIGLLGNKTVHEVTDIVCGGVPYTEDMVSIIKTQFPGESLQMLSPEYTRIMFCKFSSEPTTHIQNFLTNVKNKVKNYVLKGEPYDREETAAGGVGWEPVKRRGALAEQVYSDVVNGFLTSYEHYGGSINSTIKALVHGASVAGLIWCFSELFSPVTVAYISWYLASKFVDIVFSVVKGPTTIVAYLVRKIYNSYICTSVDSTDPFRECSSAPNPATAAINNPQQDIITGYKCVYILQGEHDPENPTVGICQTVLRESTLRPIKGIIVGFRTEPECISQCDINAKRHWLKWVEQIELNKEMVNGAYCKSMSTALEVLPKSLDDASRSKDEGTVTGSRKRQFVNARSERPDILASASIHTSFTDTTVASTSRKRKRDSGSVLVSIFQNKWLILKRAKYYLDKFSLKKYQDISKFFDKYPFVADALTPDMRNWSEEAIQSMNLILNQQLFQNTRFMGNIQNYYKC